MKKCVIYAMLAVFMLTAAVSADMCTAVVSDHYSVAEAGWGKKAAKAMQKVRKTTKSSWSKAKKYGSKAKANVKKNYKEYKKERDNMKRKNKW